MGAESRRINLNGCRMDLLRGKKSRDKNGFAGRTLKPRQRHQIRKDSRNEGKGSEIRKTTFWGKSEAAIWTREEMETTIVLQGIKNPWMISEQKKGGGRKEEIFIPPSDRGGNNHKSALDPKRGKKSTTPQSNKNILGSPRGIPSRKDYGVQIEKNRSPLLSTRKKYTKNINAGFD